MKPIITFEDFSKLDLRVGEVIECVRKEGADKLLRLTVDFGTDGKRNILSSLYPNFKPEDLQGKQFVFIINLEPRKFMGEESQGMILCADSEKPMPIKPMSEVKPGSEIL